MSKNIIEIKDVTKSFKIPKEKRDTIKGHLFNFFKRNKYNRFDALKGINLNIKEGDSFGFIGRNGGGKSTLLKIIASIYLPDAGEINVYGKIVPFLELGVGFHPELTGRENIFLNGTILGMKKSYISSKFDEIVKFAEIKEFIDMPLKNYSSGMSVRLGFSVAIQANADIYLIDEVLAVGDLGFQKKCMDKFEELRKKKKTILFVSHNMSQVEEICDKAILLERGEIISRGDKDKVIEDYYKSFQKLSKHKRKDKTLDAWIEKVDFLDRENKVRSQFKTGEDIRCRIYYETRKKIRRPTFGVAVYKSDGSHITGPNTRTSGYKIKSIDGKGYIDFTIKQNPLLSGRYLFTAALFDYGESNVYDFCDRQFSFSIEQNEVNQFGIIKSEHTWNLKK